MIGTGSIISQPAFTVPAASAAYTLSAAQRRAVPWSTLGTTATATWTFRSGHVAGASPAVLPLWDVRISGGFDSLDRAPAGRPFRLTVAPDLPAGAPRARICSRPNSTGPGAPRAGAVPSRERGQAGAGAFILAVRNRLRGSAWHHSRQAATGSAGVLVGSPRPDRKIDQVMPLMPNCAAHRFPGPQ